MGLPDSHVRFLSSLITIALGYLLKKTGYAKETDGEALTRIVYNLLIPALILGKMSAMELKSELLVVLLYNSAYFTVITVCSMLLFRRSVKENRGILTISSLGGSTPFSFPLIEAVWGADAVSLALFLDLPNAFVIFCVNFILAAYLAPPSNLTALNTAGATATNQIQPHDRNTSRSLSTERRKYADSSAAGTDAPSQAEADVQEESASLLCAPPVKRAFGMLQSLSLVNIGRNLLKNLPLLCFFIAMVLNLAGLCFPDDVQQYMDVLSRSANTMLLLMTGLYMHFELDRKDLRAVAMVMLFRLVFGLGLSALINIHNYYQVSY